MNEIAITHHYPVAGELTLALGGHGIAVLHSLIQRSTRNRSGLVASASLRELCSDVPASKDTVSRRIDQLERLGILERLPHLGGPFTSASYELHLDDYGIELVA